MYRSHYKRSFSDRVCDNLGPICGFLLCLLIVSTIFITVSIKCMGGLNWQFSEGQRSGTLYKISHKGLIWKTWEGELYLGTGRNGEGQLVNEKFYFSVSDPEIAKQLQEVDDRDVTLTYKQYFMRGYDKGSSSYDVVGVE